MIELLVVLVIVGVLLYLLVDGVQKTVTPAPGNPAVLKSNGVAVSVAEGQPFTTK